MRQRHLSPSPLPLVFLHTSECAFEGHPDKLADQVADAILDECLGQDVDSKVAVEVCVHRGMVLLLGEVSTQAKLNFEDVVRETCRDVGYDSNEAGLNCKTMEVFNKLEAQSPDVAQAVHGHFTKAVDELGAGDSGIMCGYATNETPELMPMVHVLATQIARQASLVRRKGVCPWLRPDGQAQVTMEYRKGESGEMLPVRISSVVIRAHHAKDVSLEKVYLDLTEHVIRPVMPSNLMDGNTSIQVNPAGRFVTGGPEKAAGVSGRRVADDTYGGWGAHGGGAISGKDSSKVDRTGAYAARWVAISLVHSGLCERCLVQLSYAISLVQPLALTVNSYGTVRPGLSDDDLCRLAARSFDLRPGAIIEDLDLQEPRFRSLATFGHFGRHSTHDVNYEGKPLWEVPKELSAS